MKALGGIDGCQLDKMPLEKEQCCCWGTPIGDRLLQLSKHLDPKGTTLMAQTGAVIENEIENETEKEAHPMGRKFAEESVNVQNFPNLYKLVRES